MADVKTLRGRSRYGLIVANLFSGILVETAPRLARALGSGGELWISGVLRSQQEEVGAAFKRAGLEHLATKMRGKWVMQRWGR